MAAAFKIQSTIRHIATKNPLFLSRGLFVSAFQNKSVPFSGIPDLYAHSTKNPNQYAISYVSSDDLPNPEELDSELIIGWSSKQDKVDPKTFVENSKFVDFLTHVLKENIHKVNDTNLKAMADWQKEGWLHIGDERNPPAWGRINFPEDIIGSVQLKDGHIQEGTYQPMPTHRIITNDGIFRLSEPLKNCVVEAAKKKASLK